MIDLNDIKLKAERFNALEVGDRIFYKKRNHVLTRRVQKIGKQSVIVIEDGKKKSVNFSRIFMA